MGFGEVPREVCRTRQNAARYRSAARSGVNNARYGGIDDGTNVEVGGQAVLEDNYNTQLLGSQNDMATIGLGKLTGWVLARFLERFVGPDKTPLDIVVPPGAG